MTEHRDSGCSERVGFRSGFERQTRNEASRIQAVRLLDNDRSLRTSGRPINSSLFVLGRVSGPQRFVWIANQGSCLLLLINLSRDASLPSTIFTDDFSMVFHGRSTLFVEGKRAGHATDMIQFLTLECSLKHGCWISTSVDQALKDSKLKGSSKTIDECISRVR